MLDDRRRFLTPVFDRCRITFRETRYRRTKNKELLLEVERRFIDVFGGNENAVVWNQLIILWKFY